MSIEFENILNFRDVGKTVNDYLGQKVIQECVLYRSARPDDATLDDRRRLTEELGIRTVLDLRTKTEHLAQAEKRQASTTPALLQSNAALAGPLQIPGLLYRQVHVTGRRLERALVHQLSWWNFIKLVFLYIFGFRVKAIRIMGREVMQPLGLIGLSLITLDESGPEIAEALRTLTSLQTPNPTLVHCTQGKDRTGMVVALALLALRVPADAITHDYLLSQPGLEPEREDRVNEMLRIGLTPAWGDCSPELVQRVCGHLDVRYGGVNGYLDLIGFGVEDRIRLVEVLGA
ncbi:putative tyrosine serine protein phosphatase [Rosellinia necatrix]|uniref:Putative tyrosine serine protein phosphatase n=1 Tax=Rosellinia necatrix TaxID=77044 RepID=A0A1W2TLJ2_ROSNE|nr:putative tyrosine serine protein phosphatase [Rosellinia necatrix]